MKAGIAELADILVVNKSDLPGAQAMATELQRVRDLRRSTASEDTPVLLTSSNAPESIERLSAAIDAQRASLDVLAHGAARREDRARYRLRSLLARVVDATVDDLPGEALAAPIQEQLDAVLIALQAELRARVDARRSGA
jgi:LAO/AO transport system kinase